MIQAAGILFGRRFDSLSQFQCFGNGLQVTGAATLPFFANRFGIVFDGSQVGCGIIGRNYGHRWLL
jgi:hypothetical protein